MRLHVLGSGSKGNAFALSTEEGALLIEAGFGPKSLQRRAAAAGLDLDTVTGIVLTHEHGDHARGAPALSRKLGVPLLCSPGTLRALSTEPGGFLPLQTTRPTSIGPFAVSSHPTTHDAAQPVAVAVTVHQLRVAFVMDIGRPTTGIRYLMHGANALVLESNYDDLLLRTGSYPPSVQHRIAGSRGHLSNRMAADLAGELCHDGLRVVVLAHLSQQCNTKDHAREAVEGKLRSRGFAGVVHVAEQDTALAPITIPAGPDPGQGELALQPAAAWPARSASG